MYIDLFLSQQLTRNEKPYIPQALVCESSNPLQVRRKIFGTVYPRDHSPPPGRTLPTSSLAMALVTEKEVSSVKVMQLSVVATASWHTVGEGKLGAPYRFG